MSNRLIHPNGLAVCIFTLSLALPAFADVVDVSIQGLSFSPDEVTVKVGDQVRWTNFDFLLHTATADDDSWNTGDLGQGASGIITFDEPGEFPYHCFYHPFMTGTVTVEALTADASAISASAGGTVNFSLFAGPSNGGRNYFLLGSVTGTAPGFPLPGGKTLPLNWDIFTGLVFKLANTPALLNFSGPLNAAGNASATLNTFGPLPPEAVGLTMHFAFLLFSPFDFVSNPVGILIV